MEFCSGSGRLLDFLPSVPSIISREDAPFTSPTIVWCETPVQQLKCLRSCSSISGKHIF